MVPSPSLSIRYVSQVTLFRSVPFPSLPFLLCLFSLFHFLFFHNMPCSSLNWHTKMGFLGTILGVLGFGIGLPVGLLLGFLLFVYSKPKHVEVIIQLLIYLLFDHFLSSRFYVAFDQWLLVWPSVDICCCLFDNPEIMFLLFFFGLWLLMCLSYLKN